MRVAVEFLSMPRLMAESGHDLTYFGTAHGTHMAHTGHTHGTHMAHTWHTVKYGHMRIQVSKG